VRVVVDTNVLVSGLISSSSAPRRIVNAILRGDIVPLVSPVTLTELEQVLFRPKIQRYLTDAGVTVAAFLADFVKVAEVVTPRPTAASLSDPKDVGIAEVAASRPPPDLLITGDDRLRSVTGLGIPIVSPTQFVSLLRSRTE
jgi:uncharacterized protein